MAAPRAGAYRPDERRILREAVINRRRAMKEAAAPAAVRLLEGIDT